MKSSILLISILIFATHSFADTRALKNTTSRLAAKSELRESIIQKVCNTSPNHPVCFHSSDFSPLSLQLTEEEILTKFITAKPDNTLSSSLEHFEGAVETQPWSGHYWPLYQGGISARHSDPNVPYTENYHDYLDYYAANPLPEDLKDFDTNILSPAEKYDLILNHKNLPLTNATRNSGKWHETDGNVESWMGICHGWAPASFVLPRPLHAVIVPAPILNKGEESFITFTPDDLKGLGSQMWAENDFPTYFVGTRCNEKEPETNRNGKIKETSCFDTDPSSFHKILIERIGKLKKSFVFDVTYNYEVWNQPVVGYKMSFFNPETEMGINMEAPDLKEEIKTAIIEQKDFKKDRFYRNRSKDTVYLLGVHIEVNYVAENAPENLATDLPEYDRVLTAYYTYDLELNKDQEIIGGEWHQTEHPDFLWTPENPELAQNYFDGIPLGGILDWDITKAVDPSLSLLANSYSDIGRPLSHIIVPLFKAASTEEAPK